ncbi:hypothetical protein ACET3X_000395 [Alternaria dauci]|uniref:Heterokaryon incompatibility domain-containing protein n=1 Tax=Alternaria dauci TaxID=48095 RepID=A0ABR3UVE7_9PLEO
MLQETSKLPIKLPATIEDSITATLRLGYRYLWVDKYCVHQQDSSDKHIQIQQMDIIYASAQTTLIAAVGEDCALPDRGFKVVNSWLDSPRRISLQKKTLFHGLPDAVLLQRLHWVRKKRDRSLPKDTASTTYRASID